MSSDPSSILGTSTNEKDLAVFRGVFFIRSWNGRRESGGVAPVEQRRLSAPRSERRSREHLQWSNDTPDEGICI